MGIETELAGAVPSRQQCTRRELVERLKAGDKGDDVPCLMAEHGCDYDAAWNLIVSDRHADALRLLENAWPQITTVEEFQEAGREWDAAMSFADSLDDREVAERARRRCLAIEKAFDSAPFQADEDGNVTPKSQDSGGVSSVPRAGG
jgi:hypothetical protein